MRAIPGKRLNFAVADKEHEQKFITEKVARAYQQLFTEDPVPVLFSLRLRQFVNSKHVDVVHVTKLAYYHFLAQHAHGTTGLHNVKIDYLEQDLIRCECEICLNTDLISV